MSRNPFRQARDNNEEVKTSGNPDLASIFGAIPTRTEFSAPSSAQPQGSKKKKKKVVIKTPPRSPEEPIRRLSLGRPPSPPLPAGVIALQKEDDEESDSTATGESDLEQAALNTRRNSAGAEPLQHPTLPSTLIVQPPANPFARTLATTEQSHNTGETQTKDESSSQTSSRNTRPVFDVDTFKNILLNGAPPPARPREEPELGASPKQQAERSSQYDDDMLQFQTKFPAMDTTSSWPHIPDGVSPTQPGSSSDDDTLEDPGKQRDGSAIVAASKQYDRPDTVSFANFDSNQPLSLGTLPAPTDFDESAEPLGTPFDDADIDKPLPAPPAESPDTVTSELLNAKTDTHTSPLSPPPPPVSRRQGTPRDPRPNHHRSSSVVSRSSIQSDTSTNLTSGAQAESSSAKAPPPPPSRRAGQARTAGQVPSASDTDGFYQPVTSGKLTMSPPPAPAPRRAPPKATPPTVKRTPSTASRTSLQAWPEDPVSVSTPSNAPRPPPPRRKIDSNRSSIDGAAAARHTSGPDSRRSSNEPSASVTRDNILSDLAALQREVDELRAKAGV